MPKGRKGKKGRKLRGRVRRHRNIDRNKVFKLTVPYLGHKTIPDQMEIILPMVHEFHSVGAWGTAGNMASFNVCGNILITPFHNPGVGPIFKQYDLAVGGSGAGFAGVQNTGYPALTAQYPNYYTSLSALYQQWYVRSSVIKCEVILSTAADESDLIITPISDVDDPAAYALMESRYSKARQISYYQGGNKNENSLTNMMSTKTLYGLKVTDDQIMTSDNNTGGTALYPTQYIWHWQIGMANKFSTAAAGTASIKVTVYYKTVFLNPKKINV